MNGPDPMPAETETCAYVKDDGERCAVTFGLNPMNGLCFHHDPDRRQEAKEARRRGGVASGAKAKKTKVLATATPESAPPPPKTIQDATEWSSWAIHQVAIGAIDPRIAREITGLVREFRGCLEKGALADQLNELQKRFSELNPKV